MIKSIVIRDVASYDDEGVTFDNLAKVNLIFGGNGTGKTTLSRLLAGPDNSKDVVEANIGNGNKIKIAFGAGSQLIVDSPMLKGLIPDRIDYKIFKECTIEWEAGRKEVVVYNQDFKKRNLTEIMPGVFTIGKNTMYQKIKAKKYSQRINKLAKQGVDVSEISKDWRLEDMELEDETPDYSVYPAIRKINTMLKRLGFTNFQIRKARKNPFCYEIVRGNGKRASETLSEGEVTIITFLYFLQQVYGSGDKVKAKKKEKVVAIDDPICSLDTEMLYVVSELVKKMMEEVKREKGNICQLIVMTHNKAFLKAIGGWQENKDTYFWRLMKKKGVTRVMSCGKSNPVRGEYEEAWEELRTYDASEDHRIGMRLSNLMRRILEAYFIGFGRYNKQKLFAGEYLEDKEAKHAVKTLAKWLDEGSHGVTDDMYDEDDDEENRRYMMMFEAMFEAMGHGAHYRMMMRED